MRMVVCAGLAALLWAAQGSAVPAAAEGMKAKSATQATRLGQHPDLTRLVLDVDAPADFRTLVTDHGRRILVGFPAMDWQANRHRLAPFGLIARFDYIPRKARRGLLVIHTSRPTRIEHKFTLPPDAKEHRGHRLVLDLVEAGKPKVAAPR